MRCLFLSLACLLLGSATYPAEIVRLNEANWSRVPGGKEVDAIYGDYLISNDRLVAVVADTVDKPMREGNLMLWDIRGAVLDLATRAENNDQLTAFMPGGTFRICTYNRAEVVRANGASVCLRVSHQPTDTEPYLAETDYTLADGQEYLTVTTRLRNTGTAELRRRVCDHLRADQTFDRGLADGGTAAWVYDRWFRAAYAVAAGEGRVTASDPKGNTAGSDLDYPDAAPGSGPAVLAPGQELTWTRHLLVGRDLAAVTGTLCDLRKRPTARASLRVAEGRGAAVQDALYTLRRGEDVVASGYTDAEGRVPVRLEPGAYTLVVSAGGRKQKTLTLDLSGDRDVPVTMDPASGVAVEVTGEDGKPIPCKVQFLGVGETRDPHFGPDVAARGVRNVTYTETGRFRQPLAVGAYDVVISRGPEYDAITRRVQVRERRFVSVSARLRRVVDTRGWISADFHSHTSESGDNTVDPLGRVLSLAAENVEFAPATEHNRVITWEPFIKALGLQAYLATCPGVEVTGTQGHQNVFPLQPALNTQNNGAPRTGGTPDVQIPRIATWGGRSERLLIENHPDMGSVFFDKDGNGVPDEGFAIAHKEMHVIEANGNPLAGRGGGKPNRALNWLVTLNRGFRIPCVSNTDTHTVFHGSGTWRNFVRCSTDDPAKIDVMEIVREAKAGHLVMSTGPFLEVSVGNAIPGDSMAAPGGEVRLRVRVQCANWVDINRVQVLVNGRALPELNFTRAAQPKAFAKGVVRFEREIPLRLAEDAHLVVVAIGEGLTTAPVMGGRGGKGVPLAMSNPIWVDVDGGGFKPNGDTLGAPLPTRGK